MTKLLIIGAGPAGVAAALEAGRLGLETTLVSAEEIGGRATWHSLLPSKVHLTMADYYGESMRFASKNIIETPSAPDLDQTKMLIKQTSRQWSQELQAAIEALSVRIALGRAAFRDANTALITDKDESEEVLNFDRAIIASGSIPIFLPRIKPDGQYILAPRFSGSLQRWPDHVIIIGGGVTGSEFAYLFSRMGSEVTWVTDLNNFLPRLDPDISARLEAVFDSRNIKLLKSSPVTGVIRDLGGVVVTLAGGQALSASHAFVAIGRKPDLQGLKLEKAGIKFDPGGVMIDDFCRTSQAGIYAVGDAAGAPYIANRGMSQARVAARSAAGIPVLPYDPRVIVEAIYTEPQIAQVGLTEQQAKNSRTPYVLQTGAYRSALKNHLPGSEPGYLKLLSDPESGIILGSAAIGAHAAELMSMAALAILGNLTVEVLAGVFPATPTYSEVFTTVLRGY